MISDNDIKKLEAYLKKTLGNPSLVVKRRERAKDSVELLLGGEFLGVIYKDEEDGETSFTLTMAILEEDL